MEPTRNLLLRVMAVTLAAIAPLHLGVLTAHDAPQDDTCTVDVAVNHATFAFVPSTGLVLSPEPLGPNRGTTFIVDGTIFPGGTLAKGNGMGDPSQPGGIGVWACKGVFTSDLGTEDV